MNAPDTKTVVCQNRKARFEYEVLETLEAGIVLEGGEVKSVRDHRVTLDGAYAVVEGGNVTLMECSIERYKHMHGFKNNYLHDPKRPRRLLLNRKEIRSFAEKSTMKGFTLIPLSVYLFKGRVKVELGVCRGKQLHDKRQALKAKDARREMRKS